MWHQQIQMMQSFHNDMVMMFQMFVAMHREHLGSVRDELDRVQELTRELTRLNAKLGQLPESAETNPPLHPGGRNEKSRAVPRRGQAQTGSKSSVPWSTRKEVPNEREPGTPAASPGRRSNPAQSPMDPAKSRSTPPPPPR